MKLERLQVILLWVFLIFFLISFALIAWTTLDGAILAESFKDILLKLFALYSVHLSVVIGGMFALRGTTPAPSAARFAGSAIGLALAWNLIVSVRIIMFVIVDDDNVTSLTTYIDTVGASSAFLVSGLITFFFVKHS
jgi:hypothetical protein